LFFYDQRRQNPSGVPEIKIPASPGMYSFLGTFFFARTLHSIIFTGLVKNPGLIAEPISNKGKIRFFIDLYLLFINQNKYMSFS